MEVKELSKSDVIEIKKTKPRFSIDRSTIYDYNKKLLKVFNLDHFSKVEIDCKLKKVQKADEFVKISEIVLPEAIYLLDGDFFAYEMSEIYEKPFKDFVLKEFENSDLSNISKAMYNVDSGVKKCNEAGIVITDLATISNIRYNKNNGVVKFLDYDDFQVCEFNTSAISSKTLQINLRNIDRYKKYWDALDNMGVVYNKNLDVFSLFSIFLSYTLEVSLSKIAADPDNVKIYSKVFGIKDTILEDKFMKLFDNSSENEYFGKDILKFSKTHKVVEEQGFKKFIKK